MTDPKLFLAKLTALGDEFAEVPGPVRALYMLTAALAVTDGFKLKCGGRDSTTEEEWLAICRLAHARLRAPTGSGN